MVLHVLSRLHVDDRQTLLLPSILEDLSLVVKVLDMGVLAL
jgi:hypothetical protein